MMFLQIDAAVKLADVLSAKTVVGILMFVIIVFALAIVFGFRLLLHDRQAVIESANASRTDFIDTMKVFVVKQCEQMGEMREMIRTQGQLVERCTASLDKNNRLLEDILEKR